jgi:hypothetical protein
MSIKVTHKKIEKECARCSLLGAEGLSCSLESWTSLIGDLASKFQFLIKKYPFLSSVSAVNLLKKFFHRNRGSGTGSTLTQNAEPGSAWKPVRIQNTG